MSERMEAMCNEVEKRVERKMIQKLIEGESLL